jgi:hypothetical protein
VDHPAAGNGQTAATGRARNTAAGERVRLFSAYFQLVSGSQLLEKPGADFTFSGFLLTLLKVQRL